MKCQVKTKKETFTVQFDGLTKGEVYALINALRIARTCSPVAQDLSSFLRNAFYEMRKKPSLPAKGDAVQAYEYQLSSAQDFMDLIDGDIGLKVVKDDEGKS
jgi:hypothetical protein